MQQQQELEQEQNRQQQQQQIWGILFFAGAGSGDGGFAGFPFCFWLKSYENYTWLTLLTLNDLHARSSALFLIPCYEAGADDRPRRPSNVLTRTRERGNLRVWLRLRLLAGWRRLGHARSTNQWWSPSRGIIHVHQLRPKDTHAWYTSTFVNQFARHVASLPLAARPFLTSLCRKLFRPSAHRQDSWLR